MFVSGSESLEIAANFLGLSAKVLERLFCFRELVIGKVRPKSFFT